MPYEISLAGRTALITGGSRGLGLAMAKAFYEAGGSVAIGARRADVNEASVRGIQAVSPAIEGQQCIGVVLDVTDPESIEAAYAETVAAFGQLDILVNNAGRSAGGAFETHTDEDWQADLDVKLFAMIRMTRLAFPAMKERGWGRVISVLNTGAKNPSAGSTPTSVSRAAQMALTKVLAAEGGPHGVNVSLPALLTQLDVQGREGLRMITGQLPDDGAPMD